MRSLLAILFSICMLGGAVSAETFKVVYDEWPPFTGKDLPAKGFSNDLLVTILTSLGHQAELTAADTVQAEDGLRDGLYQLNPSSWKTPEREEFAVYSNPYTTNQLVIISSVRALKPYQSLGDLAGKRVAVVEGYGYPKGMLDNPVFTPVQTPDIQAMIKELGEGRVDAAIGDKMVAVYVALTQLSMAPGQLGFSGKALSERPLHIVCSKKYPKADELMASINRQIEIMQADGSYQALLKKHGLEW